MVINVQFYNTAPKGALLHLRSSSLLAQLVERSAFKRWLNEEYRNVRGSSPLRGVSFSPYLIDTQLLVFFVKFFFAEPYLEVL